MLQNWILPFLVATTISGTASAITFTVTGTVTATPVTAVSGTCTPVAPLQYPVPPNTQICPVSITPANWTGTMTLNDNTHFKMTQINGQWWLVAGATSPAVGTFSVDLTATP